jgi:hypothetical protein
MIVMVAFVELKDRTATFEVMALQQSRLFKLCQDAVNRSQPDVCVFLEKKFVHVFSTHVALRRALEQLKHL